jgi:hypothetical protein
MDHSPGDSQNEGLEEHVPRLRGGARRGNGSFPARGAADGWGSFIPRPAEKQSEGKRFAKAGNESRRVGKEKGRFLEN